MSMETFYRLIDRIVSRRLCQLNCAWIASGCEHPRSPDVRITTPCPQCEEERAHDGR